MTTARRGAAEAAWPDQRVARPGGEPRNFLQCCLLLLLRERPAHGYELLDRLKPFGIAEGDAGNLYRRLRALERQGMLTSRWESSQAGPRRRTYHLTDRGEVVLDVWAGALAETRGLLDYYLDRHASLRAAPPPPRAGRARW